VCLVAVVDGAIRKNDKIVSLFTGTEYEVNEVGVLAPEPYSTGELLTGQVGYVLTGMKDTRAARVGDTWHLHKRPVAPISGFKEPKSMVFAGIFPVSASGFDQLQAAMQRLTLNDASVSVKRENSNALGAGFRCGFSGLLHMDVFRQRLEQEHGASVIVTAPTVPVRIQFQDPQAASKHSNKETISLAMSATSSTSPSSSSSSWENINNSTTSSSSSSSSSLGFIELQNPSEFPQNQRLSAVYEPTVRATIITPTEMVGSLMTLCQDRRGELLEHSVLGTTRAMLRYCLPLAELGGDFYDELKSSSSGYASFDYEEGEYRPADLVRLDVLVNGEAVDALARVVHRSRAAPVGRALVAKLRELMDRQQFDVALQASAGGRVVARETLKAFRKNVIAKCYGGDISRKRKLLEKQKEGKKKMKMFGKVNIPQDAFIKVLKSGD
jgi:translation elongation factor EF-4